MSWLYETVDHPWAIELAGSDGFNIFAYAVVLWMLYTLLVFALDEAFGCSTCSERSGRDPDTENIEGTDHRCADCGREVG